MIKIFCCFIPSASLKLRTTLTVWLIVCSLLPGFTLHIKHESEEWKQFSVKEDARSFLFKDLECGTRYEFYMSAYNVFGNGAPSATHLIATNGSGEHLTCHKLCQINKRKDVVELTGQYAARMTGGCQAPKRGS